MSLETIWRRAARLLPAVAVGGMLTSTLHSLIVGQAWEEPSRVVLTFIRIVVLLYSIIIHEISHGLMSERLGDPTARRMGRITLNPIPHIDPIGTVLIPAFLIIMNSQVILGWAKGVPTNITRFKNPLRDFAISAAAGPASNMAQALVYAGLAQLAIRLGWPVWIWYVGYIGTVINLVLGFFNLIPIPPLDGSRLIAALLPEHVAVQFFQVERFGFMIIFFLLWMGVFDPIFRAVHGLAIRLVT